MKVSLSSLWRKGKSKPSSDGRRRAAKPQPRPQASPGLAWPEPGTAAIAWINDEGLPERSITQFQGRSRASVDIYSDLPIASNQAVWLILDDGGDVPGTMQRCENEGEGFRVTIAPLPTEAPAADSAPTRLKWVDSTGRPTQAAVSLKNADQGRLQVVSSVKVAAPAVVLLSAKGFQCLGSITACSPQRDLWTLDLEVLGEAYSRPVMQTAPSA